ncbi:MAG: hypothetical protein ACYC5M_01675 [Anaerolineae bacterium]
MTNAQVYVAVSLIALAAIFLILFLHRKAGGRRTFTPLVGIAMAFVIASILFGADRLVGYSLLGIGVALAVIDLIARSRKW